MGCINAKKLQAIYPDRTLNAGIAEQNAAAVAGGMAAAGMKVFVHFLRLLCVAPRVVTRPSWRPAILGVPVHTASVPIRGVTAAFNGATHMPFEDAARHTDDSQCGGSRRIPVINVQTRLTTKALAGFLTVPHPGA